MKRMLVAGVALAAGLGFAGLAVAQTPPTQAQLRPAPPVGGPLMGIEPMVGSDSDATLSYRDGPGVVEYRLGAKMINCGTAGAPSGGSTGRVPSPGHPCR
jgi:hypothetical protein